MVYLVRLVGSWLVLTGAPSVVLLWVLGVVAVVMIVFAALLADHVDQSLLVGRGHG